MISIIVPVYNVEKYINRCIKSIINQSYTNIELILVNDGSTDNSGSICEEWATIDERIIVVNKENGGLSSARNAGLDVMTGKFVCFVDSDDYVSISHLKILYEGIALHNSDISVTGFTRDNFSTEVFGNYRVIDKNVAMLELFTDNKIKYSANNKLFDASLFIDQRFDLGMIMEDKGLMYKLIDSSNRIALNSSRTYHYIKRQGSILNSGFDSSQLDALFYHEEILKYYELKYPEYIYAIKATYGYEAIRLLFKMLQSNYNGTTNINHVHDKLVQYSSWVMKERFIPLRIKLLCVLFVNKRNFLFLKSSKLVKNILQRIEVA